MKKKVLAMLTSLALLLYSTPVLAADLPITISNSWTVQHTGGELFVYHTLHWLL